MGDQHPRQRSIAIVWLVGGVAGVALLCQALHVTARAIAARRWQALQERFDGSGVSVSRARPGVNVGHGYTIEPPRIQHEIFGVDFVTRGVEAGAVHCLAALGVREIVLCGAIELNGTSVAGTHVVGGVVYLSLVQPVRHERTFWSAIWHEAWHVHERGRHDWEQFDRAWIELMPVGFAYQIDYRHLVHDQRNFVSQYAMSMPFEDRAETFAADRVWPPSDPRRTAPIQEKMRLLREATRELPCR